MLLISSSSLDDGVGFEVIVFMEVRSTELPILCEVPVDVLDVVEHVDFFLVRDVLILPPTTVLHDAMCSGNEGGEFGVVARICPLLLIILQVAPDSPKGVNSVAVVGSETLIGNGVEWTVLLLFSIFMLKHWVGVKICCGDWIDVADIVEGTCIATGLFSSMVSGSTLMKSLIADAGKGSIRFLMTDGKGVF